MESSKGAMGHEDETFEEFTARYDRHGHGKRSRGPSGGFSSARFGGNLFRSSID